LLHDKVKDIYILWTRWGRIGDVGQYQRTPFSTRLGAEDEFKKVFKQKSGAKWDDVQNYQAIHKKYKLKRLSGKVIY
jgi:predicted DNA-binding WGR domain protein